MQINLNKHVWEGWTVGDFIDDLEPLFDIVRSNASEFGCSAFETKEDVKKWCMDNQPGYKKYIPEVVNYFASKIK
jgi:hypothetical protein